MGLCSKYVCNFAKYEGKAENRYNNRLERWITMSTECLSEASDSQQPAVRPSTLTSVHPHVKLSLSQTAEGCSLLTSQQVTPPSPTQGVSDFSQAKQSLPVEDRVWGPALFNLRVGWGRKAAESERQKREVPHQKLLFDGLQ